jgi:hypothetical protein
MYMTFFLEISASSLKNVNLEDKHTETTRKRPHWTHVQEHL